MKKLTQEFVEKQFELRGYKLLSQYNKNNEKMLCEKNGYWYQISYSNLSFGKTPSLWGIANFDNIEHNVNNLFKIKNVKAEFVSAKQVIKNHDKMVIVTMKCECGNLFNMTTEDLPTNKHICCYKCQRIRIGKNRRISNKNIELIKSLGYKIIDDRESFRNDDYIEVEDTDGFRGFVCPSHLKYRNNEMSKFDIRVNKKHYVYNVNHFAKLQGLEVECLSLSDKKFTRQAIKCKCKCGNIFETSISSFQAGKFRCAECARSISKYELMFKNLLDTLHIDYIHQYSINQCRDILPLPFDFYLIQYDLLIEVDGEGHYYPCYFNQMSYEQALKTFKITKKHDAIKNEFCSLENRKLLRIPYTMFKDGTYQEFFQKSLETSDL